MKVSSRKPAMFISLMTVSGATVLVEGALSMHPMHHYPFLCLLLLALLTSRMKVKLPGLTGNMSVNLPFVFLAIAQLSLLEAAVIALASTLIQSLPRNGKSLQPVQLLFNVSTMTTAAGFACMVFHKFAWRHGPSGSIALVLAASAYFFVNTLPVATIISLTEGAKLVRTWGGIVHLSFPYYVAGTGITSIVSGKSGYMVWALPLAVLPVMLGIYRSYRTYFGEMTIKSVEDRATGLPSLSRGKAAGAM
jgi:MASE9 protein